MRLRVKVVRILAILLDLTPQELSGISISSGEKDE